MEIIRGDSLANPEWKDRVVNRIAAVPEQDTRHRPPQQARLWLEGKRPRISAVE